MTFWWHFAANSGVYSNAVLAGVNLGLLKSKAFLMLLNFPKHSHVDIFPLVKETLSGSYQGPKDDSSSPHSSRAESYKFPAGSILLIYNDWAWKKLTL